ncbi:MAG: GNAT family N-acetyltransferase [Chloroflexi bacterium]|nr:GNAT family N-acetyltransferase [Chloroflexota bacterium]
MNPILRDFPDHFETERLLIRSPRPGDGQMLFAAVTESIEHLKPWMPWAHQPITLEAEEGTARRMHADFLKREDLPLFIFNRKSGAFIGGSGLHRFDWAVPRFEIGYWVRTREIGKGYITEAVAGIANFAFEQLFAERIEIRVDNRNESSWRIPERLKFTLEGIHRRDARGVQGELRDTRVYAMIRDEWLERKRDQD